MPRPPGKPLAVLIAAACLAAPGSVRAEDADSRLKLSGFFGAHVFSTSSALGDSMTTSIASAPALGPRLGFRLTRRLALEGELPLSLTSSRDDRADLLILLPRAQLRFDVLPGAEVKPAGVVGLGAPISLSNKNSALQSDLSWSGHVGASASIEPGRGLGFRLDVRAIALPGRGQALAPELEVLLGVYLRPRPKKKPSRPSEPEVADLDGDGVPDEEDECPDRAEDRDEVEDHDGCPEIDADLDAVLDIADECTLEPETRNGYEDEDGCPDALPAELAGIEGPLRTLRFRPGSSSLSRAGRRTLRRIERVLERYPSVRLEISGHTDDTGSRQANVDLSLRRAEAVAAYLVDRGIPERRLETVGVGPDRPIADNGTRRGRARNRRIELKIWVYEP